MSGDFAMSNDPLHCRQCDLSWKDDPLHYYKLILFWINDPIHNGYMSFSNMSSLVLIRYNPDNKAYVSNTPSIRSCSLILIPLKGIKLIFAIFEFQPKILIPFNRYGAK